MSLPDSSEHCDRGTATHDVRVTLPLPPIWRIEDPPDDDTESLPLPATRVIDEPPAADRRSVVAGAAKHR